MWWLLLVARVAYEGAFGGTRPVRSTSAVFHKPQQAHPPDPVTPFDRPSALPLLDHADIHRTQYVGVFPGEQPISPLRMRLNMRLEVEAVWLNEVEPVMGKQGLQLGPGGPSWIWVRKALD
jgi:hypothetical protein